MNKVVSIELYTKLHCIKTTAGNAKSVFDKVIFEDQFSKSIYVILS